MPENNVDVQPATVEKSAYMEQPLRVAACCRVSTEGDGQLGSPETQIKFTLITFIGAKWLLVLIKDRFNINRIIMFPDNQQTSWIAVEASIADFSMRYFQLMGCDKKLSNLPGFRALTI